MAGQNLCAVVLWIEKKKWSTKLSESFAKMQGRNSQVAFSSSLQQSGGIQVIRLSETKNRNKKCNVVAVVTQTQPIHVQDEKKG